MKKSLRSSDSKLPTKERLAIIEGMILCACRPQWLSISSRPLSVPGGYGCQSCGERFEFDARLHSRRFRAKSRVSMSLSSSTSYSPSELEKLMKEVETVIELMKRDKEMTRARFDRHNCDVGPMHSLSLLKKHGVTMALIDALVLEVGSEDNPPTTSGGGAINCNLCRAGAERPAWMAVGYYPPIRHRETCPISLLTRFFPEKIRTRCS